MANRFFPNYDTYKITSKYGMRTLRGSTSMHNGIDLVAKATNGGSRTDYITAHTGGTVTATGYDASAGNYVYIKTSSNVIMVYFHMKDNSITVKKGDKVVKGQKIGYMGSTGNSTGAHLHFGIKVNGEWVNPEPYLDKDYVAESDAEEAGVREIKLKPGTTYYNGRSIPSWVFNKTLYYRGTNKNGVVFSTLKTGAVTGTVKAENVIYVDGKAEEKKETATTTKAATFSNADIGVAKIKLKPGATYHSGKTIPSWVFGKTLYYRGTNKNGIVFSTLKEGAVTGTTKPENVIKL